MIFGREAVGDSMESSTSRDLRDGPESSAWAASRFFSAESAIVGSRSIKTARRPVAMAATPAAPLPAKGSRRMALRGANARMRCAKSRAGLPAGCPAGFRSFGTAKNLSSRGSIGCVDSTFEGYRPALGSNGARSVVFAFSDRS